MRPLKRDTCARSVAGSLQHGASFIEGDAGVIADTPLAGAAHMVIEHAIAGKHAHGAVVQLHGELDDGGAPRPFQEVGEPALDH